MADEERPLRMADTERPLQMADTERPLQMADAERPLRIKLIFKNKLAMIGMLSEILVFSCIFSVFPRPSASGSLL